MITTPLPESGTGFTGYGRQDGGFYGTASTVAALQRLGLLWSLVSPTPFSVGDISLKGGGAFPPHGSHRFGLDVDVRPLRVDGKNEPVTYLLPEYDRALTTRFVTLARAVLDLRAILFNDPELRRAALVTYYAGHDNHLHIALDPAQRPFLLKRGSRGAAVEAVQTRLVALAREDAAFSAGVSADGDYGRKTEAAVRAVQQRAGLGVTGATDNATLKVLAA